MSRFSSFIPAGDEAVALPTPTLGIHLLRMLGASGDGQMVHPHNVINRPNWEDHDLGSNPAAFLRAIAEAWAWLVAEGLVARRPDQHDEFCFITRRGIRLAGLADPLRDIAAEARLAQGLHPKIERRIRQQFL